MVSLAEAANGPVPRDPRLKCGVEVWMRSLDVEEREAADQLVEQIRGRERSVADVWALFVEHGFTLRPNSVYVHKAKSCACYR